uniref:Putative ovule protein n=1 Tax=Solanum chacoense TaxID=4108 RepID=A0A0V0GLE7_SOLCH
MVLSIFHFCMFLFLFHLACLASGTRNLEVYTSINSLTAKTVHFSITLNLLCHLHLKALVCFTICTYFIMFLMIRR